MGAGPSSSPSPAPKAGGGGKPLTAAGTPSVNPGGRWSKFKTYSTFQRTKDIWGFGLSFFFKLWAIGQKWSYGKEGKTEAALKAKRAELVGGCGGEWAGGAAAVLGCPCMWACRCTCSQDSTPL